MWDQLRALAGILPKRRRRLDDLARELQQHLDLEADEYRASGLSAEDARAAARRALENPTLVAEDVRAVWNVRWAETLWRDIRHGARTLHKNVGFSLVAVLTLALGIGANTAIFTALDPSFLVAQRRIELAVRMAIGASGRAVLWLVLRESLGMAVIGSALGLAAAAAAQRMTSGLLFGVSPIDPLTFGVATVVLLGIAAVATLVPGVRATRIDPARALYQD